jgi:hypothetical protein
MSAVIVVDVDGSAEAAEALEYATAEAARRAVPAPSWDLQPAAQEAAQRAVVRPGRHTTLTASAAATSAPSAV